MANIDRRKALLLGGAGVGMAAVAAEELQWGLIRNFIASLMSEEGHRPFELNESLMEELRPFTTAKMQPAQTEDRAYRYFVRHAKEFYPTTLDVEKTARLIASFYPEVWPEMDYPNRRLAHWLTQKLNKSKVLDQLKDLREKNRQRKKKSHLVLLPQIHEQSEEMANSELINRIYQDTINASARNITGILQVLNRYKPKIGVEGHPSEIELDEEAVIALASKNNPDDPKEMARVRRYIASEKKMRPWLYDADYQTCGIEQTFLKTALHTFDLLCEEKIKCYPPFHRMISILFSVLIREQFAIETILQRLDDDELGVITIGISHIPSMQQYMRDVHPNVQTRTIVPKFQ